jgi:hypothetical protein
MIEYSNVIYDSILTTGMSCCGNWPLYYLILDSTSLGGRHFFLELVKNIAEVSQLSVQ